MSMSMEISLLQRGAGVEVVKIKLRPATWQLLSHEILFIIAPVEIDTFAAVLL